MKAVVMERYGTPDAWSSETWPLPDAFRLFGSGDHKGKIVVTLA